MGGNERGFVVLGLAALLVSVAGYLTGAPSLVVAGALHAAGSAACAALLRGHA